MSENMYGIMGIDPRILALAEGTEAELAGRFQEIDRVAEHCQLKVLDAMRKNRIGEMHLKGSTGYGYNDVGRDGLERVYADIFRAEDALVRAQITCGTHALNVALASQLVPGDEIFSATGAPYDTLEEVIGIRPAPGSLAELGITYAQADLLPDGGFDFDAIRAGIHERTKMVIMQRSRGYSARPSLTIDRLAELIAFVRSVKPEVIIMVDNCYGEFIEEREPVEIGADMAVGSRRRGSDGRVSDQKPGRRTGFFGRLYRRIHGMHRARGVPSEFSGTRKGSRRLSGAESRVLSGNFSRAYRHGRRGKGGGLRRADL